MSSGNSTQLAASNWGWGVVLAVAALLSVNGIALYAFIMETHVERTVAILVTGLGLQSIAVAIAGLRTGSRWAWSATWVLFAVMAAIGIHALTGDSEGVTVGVWYFFLASVVLAGQILSRNGR
jgi:hypothetical protein